MARPRRRRHPPVAPSRATRARSGRESPRCSRRGAAQGHYDDVVPLVEQYRDSPLLGSLLALVAGSGDVQEALGRLATLCARLARDRPSAPHQAGLKAGQAAMIRRLMREEGRAAPLRRLLAASEGDVGGSLGPPRARPSDPSGRFGRAGPRRAAAPAGGLLHGGDDGPDPPAPHGRADPPADADGKRRWQPTRRTRCAARSRRFANARSRSNARRRGEGIAVLRFRSDLAPSGTIIRLDSWNPRPLFPPEKTR